MINSLLQFKKTSFFTFLFAVLFTFTACEIKPVEIASIDAVKILKINKDGVELEINMTLKNPNSIGFTVTGADLKGSLGGMAIGDVKIKNNVRIPKNSEKSHTFKITAKIDDLINGGIGALTGLLSKGGPQLKIKGDLKVRSFLIPRRFPIEFTKKIPMNPMDMLKGK
jgi:LEA14-like dessication related protein